MKIISVFCLSLIASLAAGDAFPGWQGLRVIKSENGASKMLPLNLGDEGRSLLVVKTRQSRLDLYRYTGRQAVELTQADYENPNYLPMAEDFEKSEITLDRLPYFAMAYDLNGDGVDEIFVVQGDPRRMICLEKNGEGWSESMSWEISNDKMTGAEPVLIRQTKKGHQAVISLASGIQLLDLKSGTEADWLQPREREINRLRWWLADLDGDGDDDLIETLKTAANPLRWYEADGEKLHPAVNISDDITNARVVKVRNGRGKPEVVMLGVGQSEAISFYELGEGEGSVFGKRTLLPLNQVAEGKWASLRLEGKNALVELGNDKPVLNLYEMEKGFWKFRKAFPILQDVVKILSRRDKANTLLFEVDGENDLYESRWESGRFTFPKSLGDPDADQDKATLLGFDQFGDDIWWARQEGKRIVLKVWGLKDDSPREVVFDEVSGDFESAVWLGGEELLVKKKFSKTLQFCRLEEGKTVLKTSRLKSSELDRLIWQDGVFYMKDDGVVQKLGKSLEIVDQIMLEGDSDIGSFTIVDGKTIYALDSTGEQVHRLVADKSGIYSGNSKIEVPYSFRIYRDPVLGFALASGNSINIPQEGRPTNLVMGSRVDPNADAVREFEKRRVNNIFVVDIDGDGIDEVAAVDYGRHEITIYRGSEENLKEVISWKVYDDGKYPYGQDNRQQNNSNPYRMLSFDLDGDEEQDLVLACHDRILIYLAKEAKDS
ncbi:MAG: hypothetical protein AAGB46_01775 [Verrucomicrobiota bacterium]